MQFDGEERYRSTRTQRHMGALRREGFQPARRHPSASRQRRSDWDLQEGFADRPYHDAVFPEGSRTAIHKPGVHKERSWSAPPVRTSSFGQPNLSADLKAQRASSAAMKLSRLESGDPLSKPEVKALYVWLKTISLQDYLPALLQVGVQEMSHLPDVEVADLEEAGMARPERKRFVRAQAELALHVSESQSRAMHTNLVSVRSVSLPPVRYITAQAHTSDDSSSAEQISSRMHTARPVLNCTSWSDAEMGSARSASSVVSQTCTGTPLAKQPTHAMSPQLMDCGKLLKRAHSICKICVSDSNDVPACGACGFLITVDKQELIVTTCAAVHGSQDVAASARVLFDFEGGSQIQYSLDPDALWMCDEELGVCVVACCGTAPIDPVPVHTQTCGSDDDLLVLHPDERRLLTTHRIVTASAEALLYMATSTVRPPAGCPLFLGSSAAGVHVGISQDGALCRAITMHAVLARLRSHSTLSCESAPARAHTHDAATSPINIQDRSTSLMHEVHMYDPITTEPSPIKIHGDPARADMDLAARADLPADTECNYTSSNNNNTNINSHVAMNHCESTSDTAIFKLTCVQEGPRRVPSSSSEEESQNSNGRRIVSVGALPSTSLPCINAPSHDGARGSVDSEHTHDCGSSRADAEGNKGTYVGVLGRSRSANQSVASNALAHWTTPSASCVAIQTVKRPQLCIGFPSVDAALPSTDPSCIPSCVPSCVSSCITSCVPSCDPSALEDPLLPSLLPDDAANCTTKSAEHVTHAGALVPMSESCLPLSRECSPPLSPDPAPPLASKPPRSRSTSVSPERSPVPLTGQTRENSESPLPEEPANPLKEKLQQADMQVLVYILAHCPERHILSLTLARVESLVGVCVCVEQCVCVERAEFMELGGVTALMSLAASHADSQDLQIRCLGVLSSLALRTDAQTSISMSGGVELVLAAMTRYPDSDNVQCLGCKLLCNLAFENRDVQVRIARAEGLRCVVRAMDSFLSSAHVQAEGCGALCNLAANTDRDLAAEMKQEGALGVVIKAMSLHGMSKDVQFKGCSALCALSDPSGVENDDDDTARVCAAVIQAMRKHTSMPGLQYKGCSVLCDVSRSTRGAAQVGQQGGATAVLEALKTCGQDLHLVCKGLKTMQALLSCSRDVCLQIVQLRGTGTIVDVMRRHPFEEEVQIRACAVLGALCRDANSLKKTEEHGGVDAICTCVASWSHSEALLVEACRALAVLVLREGALEVIQRSNVLQCIRASIQGLHSDNAQLKAAAACLERTLTPPESAIGLGEARDTRDALVANMTRRERRPISAMLKSGQLQRPTTAVTRVKRRPSSATFGITSSRDSSSSGDALQPCPRDTLRGSLVLQHQILTLKKEAESLRRENLQIMASAVSNMAESPELENVRVDCTISSLLKRDNNQDFEVPRAPVISPEAENGHVPRARRLVRPLSASSGIGKCSVKEADPCKMSPSDASRLLPAGNNTQVPQVPSGFGGNVVGHLKDSRWLSGSPAVSSPFANMAPILNAMPFAHLDPFLNASAFQSGNAGQRRLRHRPLSGQPVSRARASSPYAQPLVR